MLELVLVALLLCWSLLTWSMLYVRRRAGGCWVPFEARSLVPWGLLDVFLALGLLVLLTSLAMAGLGFDETGPSDEARWPADANRQAAGILAQALASLAVVAISAISIRVRYRAADTDLGWSAAKIRGDIRLGARAFLALAPPVYALQICLVQWFESRHPLVELMQHNPQPHVIAVCIVSAVLVAPVIEEYLFRGLVQGWLERLAAGRDDALALVLGGPAYELDSAPTKTAYWPIAASALTFSILHFSHGPDWIPLFVLALGLGYLYRQTHRLLPVMVVHFLLNACSMLMLLVS